MSLYKSYYKNAVAYFKKHPEVNATVHAIGGLGVGILITNPLVGEHPVKWAGVLILLSIIGHLYAALN